MKAIISECRGGYTIQLTQDGEFGGDAGCFRVNDVEIQIWNPKSGCLYSQFGIKDLDKLNKSIFKVSSGLREVFDHWPVTD